MQDSESTGFIQRPKTKMDLVERVGSKGKYQIVLLIIFCGVWGVTGMALLGTSFYFLNFEFNCEKSGLLGDDCRNLVCSLPQDQWEQYIDRGPHGIESIATQFGPYLCQNEVYLDLTSSSVYVGALVGYVGFSFYSDNYGRRITMIVAWGIATLGSLLIIFSQNLPVVALGLFFLGAGADAAVNMCFNFLGQVVQDNTRQKFSVMLQPWFAIGACFITTMFYFVDNWRIVMLILVVIPCVIIMLCVVIYIEETPHFLLRKGVDVTLKALNRMGKINKGLNNILVEEDIINVINQQVEDKQFHQTITPIDLCRFSSLRVITLCLSFLSFSIYALYYGPILAIDRIGFNIFLSSYVVQFSELIVYAPLYLIIDKVPRKKAGIILYSVAGACACVLLFINKPKDCDFCPQALIELIFVAIFRSSSALYFIVMYIYMVELYPIRSRAMGGGIASSVGTLASSLSPIILGIFQRRDLNPNILFAILAFLSVGVSTFLPETLGQPLQQEIKQIELAKKKVKQSGYLAYQSRVGGKSQYSKIQSLKQQKSELEQGSMV